ncbi:MAG: hypothetical protein WCS18_12225 [Sphaerochaetaceae bacterium]
MQKQRRLVLTLKSWEEQEINAAYARYLTDGREEDKLPKNKWVKNIVMREIQNS